jgi:hypothetical protein
MDVIERIKQANIPQETVIAVFEAGVYPFFMPEYRYHDMLGKNDSYIANTRAQQGLVDIINGIINTL